MRKLALARNPLGSPYTSFGRVPGNNIATGASVPAPVEGWDAISPLAAMSPKRAVRLDNWFPQPDWVEVRKGFIRHADTGTAEQVETLAAYQGVSSQKLFAISNGTIWDVTSAGTATSQVTALANDRFQHINFSTTGGNFLYMVNGADIPQYYNGTAWATATITGIDPTAIIGVNAHKARLWFVLEDSSEVAYLAADAIQGAATAFELGGLMTMGGYIMAMGTWSLDAGDGPDDYAVFVTSRGQCIIYAGTNPASATTWSLVGVFNMGAPIGRRCLTKVGADLAVISIDGVLPLSKAMIFERSASTNAAITQRIQRVMNFAAQNYRENFGWQLISYPKGTRAILNIPVSEGATQHQYVMNTLSGAWCRFTGMNANCWELLNDRLYFGGNGGIVFEADRSGTDSGGTLEADMMTAFNYFGARGMQKRWTMCRPLITTDNQVQPGIAFNVDFQDNAPLFVPDVVVNPQALWDVAEWDDAVWAGDVSTSALWSSVSGIGYCASIRMAVEVPHPIGNLGLWGSALWGVNTWSELDGAELTLQVNGFDLTYARGGFI